MQRWKEEWRDIGRRRTVISVTRQIEDNVEVN